MKGKVSKDSNSFLRINVRDKTELKFWSARLGVTKATLKTIVHEVGDSLTAVTEKIKG